MALTPIQVTYGANGLVGPDGQPAAGTITLQPVQETPDAGYTIVSRPVPPFRIANGILAGTIESNGQPMQVLVYENITGARNPAPYVVAIPTSGTLDLSTADRGTIGVTSPLYILASARGVPGGVATLGGDGILTAAQRPPGATALWQLAETYAGLSNPAVLTPYPGNDPSNGITLASGTYQNYDFVCTELILPNDNTKLVNCRITCSNANFGVRLDANTGQEVGRYLEHCQITAAGVGLSGAGFTARLCEVVNNGDDSARLGRSHAEPTVLELCHFHDYRPAAGAHADGVQIVTPPAADVVVWGCSISMNTATGYTLPSDAGYTGAIFVDTSDVPVSGGDPEPTRRGGIWVDSCKLVSSNNYTLVIDGPNTDVRNSTLLPGTTAVESIQAGITVTGGNNVDGSGTPIVDTDIHSDPRDRYLVVGDPRQSGSGSATVVRDELITSGSIFFPNTSGAWVPLNHADGTTPLELDVPAAVGDRIWVAADGLRETGNAVDYAVIVGSSIVRYLATRTATPAGDGSVGWYSGAGGFTPVPGRRSIVVASGDLDGGNVRIAWVTKGTGAGRIFAGPDDTFYWSIENVGH